MTIAETDLAVFGQLTRALGITTGTDTNAQWFTDPLGGSTQNPTGLKTILANDLQREALVDFVDEVLGPPAADTRAGTTWLPLFRNPDPQITVYAVLTPVAGAVHLGVGAEHSTGDTGPRVTTRVHAPLFRVPRGGPTLPHDPGGAPDLPQWLLLGREPGRVLIEIEATFTDDPPVAGQAHLRGLSAGIEVPTDGVSDVGFTLTLRDLQIPGATAPSSPTLDLDSLDELGEDVFEFAVGLLRAQLAALDTSDAGLRIAAGLSGLLGLREVPDLPAFPLADLPEHGVAAITAWVRDILADNDARDAWLGQLALLTDGTLRATEDAVAFSIGPAELVLGLRVTPGTDGHLVLVPWLRLDLAVSSEATVTLSADLLRADTSTGAVTAVPALDLLAVFGHPNQTPKLLASGPIRIGSVTVGIGIDVNRHPAPRLLLHQVDLAADTASPIHHDVLDLSSPDAALAAVDTVVADLVTDLLDDLGPAGSLIGTALGIGPPTGITPISVPALLADPLGALTAYWRSLLASAPAGQAVFSDLAQLLTGSATTIAGTGSPADPWLLPLHPSVPVALAVSVVGDVLTVAVSAAPTHTLTETPLGDVDVMASLSAELIRLDLATPSASFLTAFGGRLRLAPTGADPFRLHLAVADLTVGELGLDVAWHPTTGLLLTPAGEVSLTWTDLGPPVTMTLPLPSRATGGGLVLGTASGSASGPAALGGLDISDLELALGRLLLAPDLAPLHPFVELLGWSGVGPRLAISALLEDPVATLEDWAADLALDCSHLHTAMAALATVLSAGAVRVPYGLGREGAPYRAPVGGHRALPALTVWTRPPCPRPPSWGGWSGFDPGPAPTPEGLVAALRDVADSLPEIADLLMARPGLDVGLESLLTRCTGTDGLVAGATGLPAGVTSTVLTGYGFAEARAASVLNPLPYIGMNPAPAPRVHLSTDRDWWLGQDAARRVDASDPHGTGAPPLPATGAGPYFVLLPSLTSTGPGVDGIDRQADRIEATLASRTAPVTLVAHGGPGAAALRAATRPSMLSLIGAVVTVGTPWTAAQPAVPTATFVGLGGAALTFLTALAGPDLPQLTDDHLAHFSGPLHRSFGLLRRMSQERAVADLPSAAAEVIRPGLTVHAVTGALTRDDLTRAFTALIEYAVAERAAADTTGAEPMQELHAGLGLPALDVALGPIALGVSADLSLLSVHADAPRLRTEQVLTTSLRFGVTDGWLLGGPGAAQRDLEVRWVEVLLRVPLSGASGPAATDTAAPDTAARCELVLHEARAYTAYRERWVVSTDDLNPEATLALPEVKLILGAVATRLHDQAPALADLLTDYGLFRTGGLDPTGLDRLLFDTPAFLAAPLADPATLVTRLRAVLGTPAGATATSLRLGDSDAGVEIDLATGAVLATASVQAPDAATVGATVSVSNAGVTAQLTLGALEASGGLRLRADLAAGGPTISLDLAAPGHEQTIALYPSLAHADIVDLLRIALPTIAGKAALDALRTELTGPAGDLLDQALTAVGLLDPVLDQTRIPVGLLLNPGAYLRTQVSPLACAVTLLDAAAALVVPDRTTPGWPLTDDVRLTYALVTDRLELTAHVDVDASVDTAQVDVTLTGGLSIDAAGATRAVLTAAASVDGYGLLLRVGQSTVSPVSLDLLRPAPGTPLAIYPAGPGLGAGLAGAATEAAVVVALNELIARRGAGTSMVQRVGTVADHLALGLDLITDPAGSSHVLDPARVSAFAADPGARLLVRLPDLAAHVLASVAAALDVAEISAAPVGTATRIAYNAGAAGGATAYLELDGTAQQVRLGARIDLGAVGVISIDEVRIGSTGVSVAVTAGPILLDLGGLQLFPVLTLRAGVAGASFERLLGAGLATSATGDRSVQVRWALDATPPQVVAITSGLATTDPAQVVTRAVGLAMNIASGVVAEQLASVLSSEVTAKLQGVVFAGGSATIDPTFVEALLDPDALLGRLYTLLWNCAAVGTPISVTIEDLLVIGLTAVPVGPSSGGRKHLGLRLSLPDGERIALAEGSLTVELECDASWVIAPVQPGLSILVLEGTATDLQLTPGVVVAGLGLRFTSAGKPLLDLDSLSIDGIAVRVYAEVSAAGVGGGAQVVLDGLSLAPGGGGSGNQLANGIMNDVGEASGNARPSFSPAIAVQKPPGQDVAVSLRAGEPPGPWWIVIQRQLGPLYVERIGFDAIEADSPGGGRRVSRISLLFTGQIDLFGLTAAVDQLSLSWNGGDVLSISSWSVDLMGLAVSADIAGASLSGGLLKIVQNSSTSYIGMLTGRFAAYGLSVFGGFTQDGVHASFFVFGGFNGPIGGPPAFFLTGIAGGLGINRGLRGPADLSQFGSYPFIAALNPAAAQTAPMEALRELTEYFPHQVGNFWFAGGISFTCFALIDGIAVLAVSFGSSGLDISIFGLARMALPRPGAALVSIELALVVRFSMSEGVFMIRAQLTDNSWLLYEDIRLTGGFAFAIWWKGPLAGQFVLTMGGYHPTFHVEGYPDVPRLGLVWRISDVLVIKGGSYFALTSEALMAGQSVEASLDLGWVWAKVTFGADGIIYFDPFSFDVRAYCRISAGIHLDLWLTTISFSITIGAEIHVWGPDFAGEVTFEIGPATVPIRFGSRRRVAPETLDWGPFVDKYLERGAGSSARALSAITGRGTLPTSTKGNQEVQGAPSSDGTPALPFRVFAEFEITVTTSIPVLKAIIGPGSKAVTPTVAGAASALGIAPMGLRNLNTTLEIHLDRLAPNGSWTGYDGPLAALAAGVTSSTGPAQLSSTAYPLGVFGAPSSSSSNSKLPSHEVVVAPSQVTLVAGIAATAPGPLMDYYKVEAKRRPLPLQATRLTRATMVNLGHTLAIPTVSTAADALTAAQSVLFDHGHEPHSALARASFGSGRSAPPMFGTLTDGLVADNGADGARERLTPATVPAATARRPIVVGFLGAGDLAARRPAATTVRDGRLKRRPAPSTTSVRSRLSTRLPVVLTQAHPTAAGVGGTVAATSYVPRTTAANTGPALHGGRLGAADLQGLVGGLGAKAGLVPRAEKARRLSRAESARNAELSQSITGGDVVVIESLDARYDGDPDHRPHLTLNGAARVLALAGASISADVEVDARSGDAAVPVPPGTTLLAVHAGGGLDPELGYAGWHDGSRVARLGDRVALASGCALSVDGPADDEGQSVAWQSAHTLTGGARAILTRFTRGVRTIAVALAQTGGPDGLGPAGTVPADVPPRTDLGLAGASIARDGADEVAPTLVVIGGISVLVYAVVPDEATTGVAVTVVNGPQWSVVGVVGADESPQTVATRIAESGLAAVVSRVTAATGAVTLGWQDARRHR